MLAETYHELLLDVDADQRKTADKAEADSAWEIRLKCVNGPLKGQRWSFEKDFRIGRLDSVDLCLLEVEDRRSVSRLHALISHDDSSWWLTDLGSTNGTRLNGRKLGQDLDGELRPRDLIQFGEVAVVVETIHAPTAAPSAAAHSSKATWATTEGFTLPHIGPVAIGEPIHYKSLTVFPLFGDEKPTVEFLLSDEAIEAGAITVAEVSQQGSVPELTVRNTGDRRVLFLEGEELRGAKQNRILNTSVLVPPHSSLKIPVSCVEQGRWRRTSDDFQASKTICPARLRRILKTSVNRSLHARQGHRSDQHTIWDDVSTQHDSLGVTSTTMSLADTCFMYEGHVAEGRQHLQAVEGCCGLIVAVGSHIVSADFFNNPETCQKIWPRLVCGLMLDDLLAGDSAKRAELAQLNSSPPKRHLCCDSFGVVNGSLDLEAGSGVQPIEDQIE